MQSLGPEATLLFEVQWSKEKSEEEEEGEGGGEGEETMQQKENIYALFHRHR